jgi:hypothetical protein
MFHGLYTVIWYRWSRASAYTPLHRFIHAAVRLRVIETRDAEIRLRVCHCQPARLRRRAIQGEPCATHGQPLALPPPPTHTPCKRAAVRASDAASARGGSTISAASVDISCSACALLECRHVASSRAPPQQNIHKIIRCSHPLRIPFKITAARFFPYFQA